jgi:hypothetical protein
MLWSVTLFGDFDRFGGKKLAMLSKIDVMIYFKHKYFLNAKIPIFWQNYFKV